MREAIVEKNLGARGGGNVRVVNMNAVNTGLEDAWGDACIAAQVENDH